MSLLLENDGEEATEVGVVGVTVPDDEYCRERCRNGDAGRRILGKVLPGVKPSVGELLLSGGPGVSSSSEIAETV